MKCEEARRTLPLFLYGELSFEEEEQLELHVDECQGCRIALEREKSLFKSLDAAELTPSRQLLENCRAELRSRLAHAEREDSSFWNKLRQGFTYQFPRCARVGATGRFGRHAGAGISGRASDAGHFPDTVADGRCDCRSGVFASAVCGTGGGGESTDRHR